MARSEAFQDVIVASVRMTDALESAIAKGGMTVWEDTETERMLRLLRELRARVRQREHEAVMALDHRTVIDWPKGEGSE